MIGLDAPATRSATFKQSHERLDAEVRELAAEIATMDPFALAMVKRAVNQTMDVIGQRYLVNRFQELMIAFDMERVHEAANRGKT